ncbi:serine kinase [Phascolarctobacterium sp.]|uniref:serine kinase n=1 Tax=Phascolarctobacterium sp. TaxID=2049039 RepID=UPI003862DEB2
MKVKEMIDALNLKLLTKDVSEDALYAEVEGGYASDLLSNAMGQAKPGEVWVTMQGHQNVAAVASLIGLAAVIVAGDGPVAEDTLHKANMNDVVVLATEEPAFSVIGKLYAMGVGK